jgi:uncharacterized protein YcfL
MKTYLLYFILLFLCVSCSEPKLKLRAPEVRVSEKLIVMDSVQKDTSSNQVKQLTH